MYFLLKKRYFFLLVVFLGILFGKTFYLFFYDKKAPIIACVGIEENGVYTNNMSVMITMEDEYGIKNCTVSIDKKEIINSNNKSKEKKEVVIEKETTEKIKKVLVADNKHYKKCNSDKHNTFSKPFRAGNLFDLLRVLNVGSGSLCEIFFVATGKAL